MSLQEVSLFEVVRKQFVYKVKSYTGILQKLMILQTIGILLAASGSTGMMGGSSGTLHYTITFFSGTAIMVMTIMWIITNGFLISTTAYKNDDFTFVSTRWSRHLANGVYIGFLAILGTLTSYMGISVIKVVYQALRIEVMYDMNYTYMEHFASLATIFGYILLSGILAYFIGSVLQFNKVFTVIGMIVIVALIAVFNSYSQVNLYYSIGKFILAEESIPIFMIKIGSICILTFIASWFLNKNQEVHL
ncbi:hypothetical protein [Paenisporosarcina antarctica]|uniref:Uncharacterized protein n=1 Tax=Paenisporosarcina antarctica TaxID=417367 RepID=A0A4P6ZUV2_9BACL|nr:hypothetical protein [Paenisporosarcina antarctica]QBP39739.1 hypothetical protein E2636_00555 [Paenisporosarcina antarctica]